jgi:hypothetical protein
MRSALEPVGETEVVLRRPVEEAVEAEAHVAAEDVESRDLKAVSYPK